MRHPVTQRVRRRRGAVAALLACGLLAAACSGSDQGAEPSAARASGAAAGAEPTGPTGPTGTTGTAGGSTSGAPLIPEATELPDVDVQDVLEQDMSDLAKQAEKIAGKTPQQHRPARIAVAAGSTRWRVGAGYRGIFADPDIVRHGETWFAYATNTSHQPVPVLASTDLSHWTAVGNALPTVGGWVASRSRGRGLWAPSVTKVGNGWTAAYSAQAGSMQGERHNCIGLARGSAPTGPFRPVGDPICYGVAQLGVIDPDLFVDDDGKAWLLWKFSGIVGQRPAGIFVRELDRDGTGFASGSQTHELLRQQDAWEAPTIENPSMVQFRGVTYLFYSGSSWERADYATGYAICVGPTGPCTRPRNGSPFLTSATTGNLGPGGASAFEDHGSLRLLYHAWDPGQVGRLRTIHVAGLWQREDGTLELVDAG